MSELSVFEVYTDQFWRHLGQLEHAESVRDFLDLYHGDYLVQCLSEGEQAVDHHFPWLSVATRQALSQCTRSLAHSWSQMADVWGNCDHYDRYGTYEGLAAGVLSDETQIGAAIGTALLPGIGTVIGAALGGFVAGNQMDKEFENNLERLDHLFKQMLQDHENLYNSTVVPAIKADLEVLEDSGHSFGDHRTNFMGDALGSVGIGIVLALIHWLID